MGSMLAHVGQGAYPTGARCLPLLGRIAGRHMPNIFILYYSYSFSLDSTSACNSFRMNSSHLT